MMVSATVIPHRPAIYTTLSTTDEMRALLVPIKGDNKESYKYKDNWFDLLAIHYLTKAIQATTGTSNKKQGYEGLVEAAVMISKKHGTKAQQNLVIQTLQKAFPVAILTMASELSYKDFIASVHVYKRILCSFHYIVLPMANWPLRARSGNQKSKGKQRKMWYTSLNAGTLLLFLESTNCVGMCTNLCKIPCQSFIQDSLGMPVYMNPSIFLINSFSIITSYMGNHLGNKTKEPRSTKGVLNASRRGAYVPGVLHAMSKLDLIGHSCAIHPFNLASEKKHSIPSLLFKWLLQGRPFPNEVDRTPVTSNLIPHHKKCENFEDMSCEMIFGQQAPIDDPSLKQPCYRKSCIAKQTHGVNCS
ncbi:hypothetical protein ZIOFF_002919 [Zingiber officinale]|uniref:Beta-carotene isomerase D27-like C-terminal domain-containing protein n=1 Tax=Zingiber officinale TaxID=94328 RepID=A0A8J5ICD2_ZINOF|nr:hypothetical protein ZIOFF_002919 [Zingiber officinale]